MTIHPINVVERVTDEYAEYLRTEFRARDPELRAALDAALAEPLFLAQEPFFQTHRPFKNGKAWSDLGLDGGLARAMEEASDSKTAFLHQSDAIAHLLGASATPLVVTTGTGSGKTECFLLPALQNAIEDAGRFRRNGLTAILIYPMNALANDQEERIRKLLEVSGHTAIQVARYDRSTDEADRERWRASPPHLLLTNYMMLEYLLVRPADRDALFANHRIRFVVLDEVHTYRGTLGANIALLIRRLFAHLRRARQDWAAEDRTDARRFPVPVPIATSATIKSVDETGRSAAEVARLRDEAVQEFFSRLVGVARDSIRVVGETLRDLEVPAEARWPATTRAPGELAAGDAEATRRAAARLAGLPETASVEESGASAAILWRLNDMLARRPLSVADIVARIQAEIPERAAADPAALRREVEGALAVGAALPDGCPGALRLRAHRFIRGGWRFYRCVDPACGRLYPMGQELCSCGRLTAPLYLCRSCGVDTLRFRSDAPDSEVDRLVPHGAPTSEGEWLLYDRRRWETAEVDDETSSASVGQGRQMKDRPVLEGSFDPVTCSFSERPNHPIAVVLAPARNRCLVCGSTAGGSGSVLTPVALGTSAAVRVLAEGLVEGLATEHAGDAHHDGKERLLIFADSRHSDEDVARTPTSPVAVPAGHRGDARFSDDRGALDHERDVRREPRSRMEVTRG